MKALLLKISRPVKIFLLILNDISLAFLVWLIFGLPLATYLISEGSQSLAIISLDQIETFLVPIFLSIIFLYYTGFYKSLTRFKSSGEDFYKSVIGASIFGIFYIAVFVTKQDNVSDTNLIIFILQAILLSSMFLSSLIFSREVAKYYLLSKNKNLGANQIVIYGAGAIGTELLQILQFDSNNNVIAFFDDDKRLKGTKIYGLPIYTRSSDLEKLKHQVPGFEVFLAIPSITSLQRREIIEKLEKLTIPVRSIPSYHEIISDTEKLSQIQQLSLEDLLPSKRITNLDFQFLSQKTIFISGAGGSIGSEIVRQVITANPKKIVLFELSEYNLHSIYQEADKIIKDLGHNIKLEFILGDVKNRKHLNRVFLSDKIDIVFHAAAYKHVPIVENYKNISASIENNVLGTFNICDFSSKFNVSRFVLVSTDKAVRPTNVMGASKRMAEIVCQAFSLQYSSTIFSMVRFGNVLNSSGSVVPLFRKQIAMGGPVTVTHRDITRYFMTISEAASLVIMSGINAKGGEVFLLDMGDQVKVFELAKRMIRLSGRSVATNKNDGGIEIIEVGLRPGEKMFEELLISGNELPTEHPMIFKSQEDTLDFHEMCLKIDELSRLTDADSIKEIIGLLSECVSGFQSKII